MNKSGNRLNFKQDGRQVEIYGKDFLIMEMERKKLKERISKSKDSREGKSGRTRGEF